MRVAKNTLVICLISDSDVGVLGTSIGKDIFVTENRRDFFISHKNPAGTN